MRHIAWFAAAVVVAGPALADNPFIMDSRMDGEYYCEATTTASVVWNETDQRWESREITYPLSKKTIIIDKAGLFTVPGWAFQAQFYMVTVRARDGSSVMECRDYQNWNEGGAGLPPAGSVKFWKADQRQIYTECAINGWGTMKFSPDMTSYRFVDDALLLDRHDTSGMLEFGLCARSK